MKKSIILVLLATASFAFGNYPNRVIKYLEENGIDTSEGVMGSKVQIVKDDVGYRIVKWDLELKQPHDEALPSEEESEVIKLPRKYWKNVGGKIVEKDEAEKEQADDSEKDKKSDVEKWSENEKAIVLFLIKEINALRQNAGMEKLKPSDVKRGIKDELK